MSNTKPDSASFSSPKLSQPPVPSPSSSRHSNGHHGQQGRGKDGAARNPPSHKHTRQSNRGKQNNSNQRSAATSADDESATDSQATLLSTPTKKPGRAARKQAKLQQAPPKIALLTRTAPEGEQQDLLARFASPQTPVQVPATMGGRSSGKRNRRPQDSPPRSDDAVVRTPSRRPNKQQFQPNPQQQSQARTVSGGPATIYSPTPRAGHVVASPHTVVPGRGGSPGVNRLNHYAGASFNNSPAPATLPLPPSFLISPSSASSPPPSFHVPVLAHSPSPSAPVSNRNSSLFVRDEDVFDMAVSAPVSADRILSQQQQQSMSYHNQVSAVLSERSRQLEHMLASGGARPNQHLNHGGLSDMLDLAQPATDMTSMFQKLRLMKEMSQNRPATVEPMAHHQLTPV
ncbi:hypothetical protein IWW39_004602 [Coemansia spiralis]|uniref:Uncharacterized protein n=1 Tax=Coemansia spiralis TaxID=417178 RepID=A0A9W8GJ40_9FUNG|nr:hypothetical protein IWW39_004602 [Coemansia spiralis]